MRPGVFFGAALVIASCSSAPRVSGAQLYIDHIYSVTRTRDVVYGTGGTTSGSMQLLMDVWQPTDKGTGAVQPNRPAIVIQDGGAWSTADKDNSRVTDFARYMAQRGFTVFTTDYRQVGDSPVAGPGPWDQNLDFEFPLNVFPGANVIKSGVEDFATAISYVRANAALYGIDPNRIAAAGGSAGAVNAMYLQYNMRTAHDQTFQAQAVVSLVGTMYNNYDLVRGPQSEHPPLFLLNGVSDLLIPYSTVSPNLHNELETRGGGLYYEQWLQDLPDEELAHGVDYDFHPWSKDDPSKLDTSKTVLERVADFLAYKLADGPVEIVVPEPSTVTLAIAGGAGLAIFCRRHKRRMAGRKKRRSA
ncbi:MAG: alpha/beta hydrolase [Pirellulales bacterium]